MYVVFRQWVRGGGGGCSPYLDLLQASVSLSIWTCCNEVFLSVFGLVAKNVELRIWTCCNEVLLSGFRLVANECYAAYLDLLQASVIILI